MTPAEPNGPAEPAGPSNERPREPGWRRGPDPDAPPWSREDADDAEDGDGDGDEHEEPPRREGRPPRGRHRQRAGGAGEAGSAGDRDDEAADHPPGHELAELPHGVLPPRPPRRTGVFVDPDDLREHVGHLLRSVLGGYEVDAFGNFTFTHEGARIFVTVGGSPIGPQVGIFSVTNLDLELSPALAAFLLTTNHTLGFGAFSYDPGNQAVWLRHTLLGTTLDLPELQSAVAAVATTAARLDHAIQERFGGRTFQEAPSEVQRKMEPPEPIHDERPPNVSGYL
jgi:hypothetical protein